MGGVNRSRALCASTGAGSSSGCSGAGSLSAHLLPTNSPTVLPTCSPYFLELSRTSTAAISTFSHFPPCLFSHTCTTFLCSFHYSYNFSHFPYISYYSHTFVSDLYCSNTFAPFQLVVLCLGKLGNAVWGGGGNPGTRQGNGW